MTTELDPVLARIQAKIAAWQAVADSYRAALALESSEVLRPAEADSKTRQAIELPVGAFRGMTIGEAVRLYLQSVRRKQTVQEIAEGLKAHGLESSAKNFGPTLRSTLHTLKTKGDLLRFPDGWDLADAHSPALRNRLTRDNGTTPKKQNGKKTSARRAAKAPTSKRPAGPKGPSLDERIQAFVATKPLEWFTIKDVADALREDPGTQAMSLAFARLVRYGRIAKQDDGRYAAVRK